MENKKIIKLTNNFNQKKHIKQSKDIAYRIYTPYMIKKYKINFKYILKMTKNRDETLLIMYKRVKEWYQNEERINLNIEKIHIKTKLGSYTTGGCGIGASLLAGLTASGVFSYIDNYVQELGTISLIIYFISVLCFGIKVLSNEDDKVEMYNVFLEVLNSLGEEKTSLKRK